VDGFFALLDPLLGRPGRLWKRTTARFVPVKVVTTTPPEERASRADARWGLERGGGRYLDLL